MPRPSHHKIALLHATRSLKAKDLPKDVERYVQEGKDKGMDEDKAWAIAWSRYCRWKNPGSDHCKKDSPDDYFPGQGKSAGKGRKAAATKAHRYYVVNKRTGKVVSGGQLDEDAWTNLDEHQLDRSKWTVMHHNGVLDKFGKIVWSRLPSGDKDTHYWIGARNQNQQPINKYAASASIDNVFKEFPNKYRRKSKDGKHEVLWMSGDWWVLEDLSTADLKKMWTALSWKPSGKTAMPKLRRR